MKKPLGGLSEQLKRIPGWVCPSAGIFTAIFTVFMVRLDPDFGWHLRSGIYILQHGIPYHDIFTYTAADFPWVNHEWLSGIIIAGVYGLGGFAAVAGLFAAIWTAALVIASRHARWVVLAIAAAAIMDSITARPNAWSALFLALLIVAVRRKIYWPVVGMFWLWANLHGGFVLGFVFLLWSGLRDRKYLLVLAASMLITLLNPYGVGLYVEIQRTLMDRSLRGTVVEWKSLAITWLGGFYIVLFLANAVVGKWRRDFWFPLFMLASAVSSTRHFTLFVIASLGVVDAGYAKTEAFLAIKPGWRRLLLPVAAGALLLVSVWQVVRDPDQFRPEAQVAHLKAEPCVGNIFNDYDFGGYLIWKLPESKLYIDGRMPSWKVDGHSYMERYMKVIYDPSVRREEFAKYDIGCVLVETRHKSMLAELKRANWRVTSQDEEAVLLRRP